MKRLVLCVLFGALLLLVAQAAFAANEISVTVTLQQIGVDVSPTSWAIGVLAPGATTTTSGPNFTATNTGNVNEDIDICTAASSAWAYGAAADVDVYVMEVSTDGGSNWSILNDCVPLATSLAPEGTQTFDLGFTCPTSGSTYDADGETITVTLTASAS